MNTRKRSTYRFLFLEFLDPEINTFLLGLQHAFSGRETSSGIHITVRGPYYDEIPGKDIEKYESIVRRDPILIHGIDMFQNARENVVFIRVHSDALEEIWWKPDFPKQKYGFHPHISLYKTSDIQLATLVLRFLKNEEIQLICHDFRLVPFSSKQMELFPFDAIPQKGNFSELLSRRRVRPGVLQRAARVVDDYRRKCVDSEFVHVT